MRISLQRNIDKIVGRVLCRVFSLLPLGKKKSYALPLGPKILVILLSEMGSLVLAHPMFSFLKKNYPSSQIFALVFKKNRECIKTLQLVPEENILTVEGDSLLNLVQDSFRSIYRMRKESMDAVLDCELFSRISSLYSLLSGADLRAGFHPHTQEGLYRGDFINRPVLYNPYRHMSRQFVHLAMALGNVNGIPMVKEEPPDDIFIIPPINPDVNERAAFKRRMDKDFPQIQGKKIVLLYPGGGLLPIRAWPLDNFCEIADELLSKGYAVGVIGLGEDAGLADIISSRCRSRYCIDLTGYTKTIMELIILFHFASLLITNDGGPGHFASLTPMPSIILFGPETPLLYAPLDPKSKSMCASLPCSPCLTAYNHRGSPCDGNNVCLQKIRPREVLNEAYAFLKERPGEDGKD